MLEYFIQGYKFFKIFRILFSGRTIFISEFQIGIVLVVSFFAPQLLAR